MTIWERRQLRAFAEAVRPELEALPTPEPGPELLDRIVASRAAGTRTILPHHDPGRRRPVVRYLVGIAAAAVLVIGLGRMVARNEDDPASPAAAQAWFTGVALAQTNDPTTPPVQFSWADRLRPIAIQYTGTVTDTGRATT